MSILLNLGEELAKQGQQARDLTSAILAALGPYDLAERELQPLDSLSIRSANEHAVVRQLVARYRALPAEQRRGLPALLNAVGKLQVVCGEFEAALKDFAQLAASVREPAAQAEAHHNAFHAALECRSFDEALAALNQAIHLAADRFAPFPPDKFEAERLLAATGLGVTFLCRNRQAGGRVLVQTLRPNERCRDPKDVLREAQALRALEHPAILRVRECDYADARGRRLFVVMDYFPGRSLAQYVESHGPLPVAQALGLARLVAEGLWSAHQRAILHRDVKPANLLVRALEDERGRRWEAKLIDFGVTCADASLGPTASRQPQTLAGADFADTRRYAAPERLRGGDATPSSDTYSFGRTCCFVLFGTAEPSAQQWKSLPRSLAELLGRCLAERPSQRPASFAEVLAEFDRLDRPAVRPGRAEDREPERPPSRPRRQEREERHERDERRPPPRPVRANRSGGSSLLMPASLLGGGLVLVLSLLVVFAVILSSQKQGRPPVDAGPGQQVVVPPPPQEKEKLGGGQVGGQIPDKADKVQPPRPQPKNRDKLNLTRHLFQPGRELNGPIDLDDWVVQCHTNGWEDYPLARMAHRLGGGVLELTNDTGVIDHAGIATRCHFEGDYAIKAEVRGTKSVGLKRATDDRAYGGVFTPGDGWQAIVLTRKAGGVAITVNGKPAQVADVNSRSLDRALFYVHVNKDTTAAVRWVEVIR